jgi:hypothetical protein
VISCSLFSPHVFERLIPGAGFWIEVEGLVRFLLLIVLFVMSCCLSSVVRLYGFPDLTCSSWASRSIFSLHACA